MWEGVILRFWGKWFVVYKLKMTFLNIFKNFEVVLALGRHAQMDDAYVLFGINRNRKHMIYTDIVNTGIGYLVKKSL